MTIILSVSIYLLLITSIYDHVCSLTTWKELPVALAARSHEAASVERERLLQSLAVALQRENARAVLRRVE